MKQNWQYCKGLIYYRPIIRLAKWAFLRGRAIPKILLAEILAYNKWALWRSASFAFSFGSFHICCYCMRISNRVKVCFIEEIGLQSTLFNTDTKGTEPIVRFTCRGVRIIEVGNAWFLAFLAPNELSVVERCPCYRGVRNERSDFRYSEVYSLWIIMIVINKRILPGDILSL